MSYQEGYSYAVCIHCYAYNQEQFIKDTLQGFAIQQTSFPFIAVVIDDHSKDKTTCIIQEFEKKYPHIIKGVYLSENHYSQGKPKRQYFARYDSQSKYIAVCEGDDYWTDPLKLQKQVEFLDNNDDYVLCCTAFTQSEGNSQVFSPIVFDKDIITLEDILQEYWIGSLTTVFRFSAIDDYKAPFPMLPMADLPLWCHLAMKGKVKYLRDITANYRRLQDSACHSTDLKKEFHFRIEAMRVREYYASKADKLPIVRSSIVKEAHYILDHCFKNKWIGYPIDNLWGIINHFGTPSGYDKLKYWGLQSIHRYPISNFILRVMHK